MHPIAEIALIGMMRDACLALVLNSVYVIDRRVRGRRLAGRIAYLMAPWLGIIALIGFDPHSVMGWWLD